MKVNKLYLAYGRKTESYRGHSGYLSLKKEKAWEIFYVFTVSGKIFVEYVDRFSC